MPALLTLFLNLILTVAVEGGVIWFLFRDARLVYYSFLCNLLTNPALNALLAFGVARFGLEYYVPMLVALELAALATEAFVYRSLASFGFRRALAVSALLNCVSYAAGAVFYRLFAASLVFTP